MFDIYNEVLGYSPLIKNSSFHKIVSNQGDLNAKQGG